MINRRTMLAGLAGTCALAWLQRSTAADSTITEKTPMTTAHWPISLAQWSLHRMLQANELAAEDFPMFTRDQFNIGGVEYVNSFFKDRSTDDAWLAALRKRCDDAKVKSVLIMVDGEGALGDPSEAARHRAVENHRRWLHAAAALGCHGIRVNVPSEGTPDEQRDLCAKGLGGLLAHADTLNLNVMIENHGGLSSNGAWLSSLIRTVDHPRLGSLPDFGNFILNWDTREMYDRYKGIDELLPFAKALSAKSNDFDADGNEVHTDFARMFDLVRKHRYTGWVGVEYEGESLSEIDGIARTRDLLIAQGCVLGGEEE
ncbi:MAG: sugar phosphate isomerase/epimerase [Phycisphaerae bacterium]|nr:sugar phosphate isomerase/epimerase [Phycisphaerae bacterium]